MIMISLKVYLWTLIALAYSGVSLVSLGDTAFGTEWVFHLGLTTIIPLVAQFLVIFPTYFFSRLFPLFFFLSLISLLFSLLSSLFSSPLLSSLFSLLSSLSPSKFPEYV